jgi:acetyl-CoA C-acetyltransferase
LPFAGGPWNNYVMHAIATWSANCATAAGETALVWANGGYVTKHAFGVYAPSRRRSRLPPRLTPGRDRRPAARQLAGADEAAGRVTIEAYTVMHGRDGAPELGIATCLLADRPPRLGPVLRRRRHDRAQRR